MVEVSRAFDTKVTDFDDGKMNIPEHHNGVPDLLDEARWELEFMMKMQVPRANRWLAWFITRSMMWNGRHSARTRTVTP